MADLIRWLPVYNADTTVVPAFGVMAITGVDDTGAFTIQQPTADGLHAVLLNGPFPIDPDDYGNGHATCPAIAAFQPNPSGTLPVVGDAWGTATGSWLLNYGHPGFLIAGGAAGGPVAGNGLVNVIQSSSTPTSLSVTDGTTTVADVTEISFTSGATVTDGGGGLAEVAISGGGGGSGTVTSVAMTVPSFLSVSGSPITTAGTLAVTLVTEAANTVLAGPTSGSVATPTFRALVPLDYPAFVASGTGHAQGAVPDPGSSAGTTKFLREDASWQTAVTSVAAAGPSGIVTWSAAVTTAGTLTATLASQSANYGFFGPASGGAAAPTFRALVPADYPIFVASGTGHAAGAVPDPGAVAGTTKFLREDSTWAVPAGTVYTGTTGQIGLTGNAFGLIATAVTAGSYTLPAITVDGFGRLTAAASRTLAPVSDTNVTLGIALVGAAYTFTMGWSSTLSQVRGGWGQDTSAKTGYVQFAAGVISWLTSIPLTDLAAIADQTLLGNASGGAASPQALTVLSPITVLGGSVNFNYAAPLAISGGNLVLDYDTSLQVVAGNLGLTIVTTGLGGFGQSVAAKTGYVKFAAGVISWLTAIPIADLATIADQRLLGNASGGTASPTALTVSTPLSVTSGNVGFLYQAPLDISGGKLVLDIDGSLFLSGGTTLSIATVTPSRGGTGLTSITAHAIMVGAGTSTVGLISPATSGRMFLDQGAAADPAYQAMSGDATLAGTGAVTLKNTGTAGTYGQVTTDAQGRVSAGTTITDISHGGTNVSTWTTYGVVCGGTTATGNLQQVNQAGPPPAGAVLTYVSNTALPIWSAGIGPTPAAATALAGTPGNTQIVWAWTAPAVPVTGYWLYLSTTSGGELTSTLTGYPVFIPAGTVTYTSTGLGNGTPYYATVYSVNNGVLGAPTSEATATPTAGVTTFLSGSGTWTAPTTGTIKLLLVAGGGGGGSRYGGGGGGGGFYYNATYSVTAGQVYNYVVGGGGSGDTNPGGGGTGVNGVNTTFGPTGSLQTATGGGGGGAGTSFGGGGSAGGCGGGGGGQNSSTAPAGGTGSQGQNGGAGGKGNSGPSGQQYVGAGGGGQNAVGGSVSGQIAGTGGAGSTYSGFTGTFGGGGGGGAYPLGSPTGGGGGTGGGGAGGNNANGSNGTVNTGGGGGGGGGNTGNGGNGGSGYVALTY